MKKLFITLFVCAMGLNALAQTNFRPISFDEALKAAKQENKLVFIDFYTDWCGPCKKMAKEVFPQKMVGNFMNEKFVNLKFNAEKEGKELAARYKVSAYPTFVILDTEGKVVGELKGSMDGQTFIQKLNGKLNPDMTPERMAERYKGGERTPELVNAYAMHLMELGKEDEGFQVVDGYFNSLSEKERLNLANAFLFTRYTIALNEPKADFMVAHRNEFAEPSKTVIQDRIGRLYHSEFTTYFSGHKWAEKLFNEEEYQTLKKTLYELDLVEKNQYEPMFRLVEARITVDDKAFLELCKAEYDNLSESGKGLLMMNMTRLVPSKDPEILKAMSAFIRAQLATSNPNVIMLSGRLLQSIEEGFKKN